MESFIVKKGKHHFKPRLFKLFWKKHLLNYIVQFDKSCTYNLMNNNQFDINKLIGLGYFSFRINPHHTDSVRFGWNYNLEKDKIELFAYCYVNKERIIKSLGFIDFYYNYEITINVESNYYKFFVCKKGENFGRGLSIPKVHNKKLSFMLGPYFGGDQTSPKKMKIIIQKL